MIRLLSSHRLASAAETSHPLFSAAGARTDTTRRYADEITVGKPGRCPERPVLMIGLYDNSGSITGGNDPIGQRFLEASLAIARVGARCRCGKDLVATLHFDTPTSGDIEPTPITQPHHVGIHRSLAVPPDGAGISCLGPSLKAAQRVAARHPEHHVVLVALTDFQLFDDYLDQFIAFPGDVHAVALRAAAPHRLIEAPTVTVTQVGYATPPGAVARAVFTALTKTRPNARALAADGLTGGTR